jgi:putative transposase
MVTAAQRSVFAQKNAGGILSHCDDLAISLAERFFKAAELMNEAREEVLAFRHFPAQHWKKVWSTNLLERVNVAARGALRISHHKAPHPRRRHLPQRRWDYPPGWDGAAGA